MGRIARDEWTRAALTRLHALPYARIHRSCTPSIDSSTSPIWLFVPSGTFDAWTVRVIAVDAATGRLVATATRMGRAPTPAHGLRLQARSRHVATGRPYPFRLYTHCGVDFSTDFDGSFWDLADAAWAGSYGNPPSAIGNPFQDGTMTLVDHDHARFDVPRDPVDPVRFPGGPIRFTRHVGPTVVPGYCS